MSLRYPQEITGSGADYVSFSHHKYSNNNFGGGGLGPAQGGSIVLYMPNTTPSVTNNEMWGEQRFQGPLQKALTTAGVGMVGSVLDTDHTDIGGSVDGIREAFMGEVQDFMGRQSAGPGAVAQQMGLELIGKLSNTNPNHLLALSKGMIYNPNIELIYQGPTLRTFNMEFSFIPKNSGEASMMNNIIKEFKTWSAPANNGSGNMYEIPHVWQVTYSNSEYMNQFKPAALMGITVQANAGANMHTAHIDGCPTSTSLGLTFQEVDVVLRKDQQSGGQGY